MQSATMPPLTIAILSSQCLVWLGLQKIIESRATMPIVVHPHPWHPSKQFPTEPPPDMFILDMDIEQNAVGTIAQLRESAPTSKLVLLCGLEDQGRAREAIGAGVDGVILKIQPPEVVLAVIEALYATTRLRPSVDQVCAEIGRLGLSGQHTGKSASPPPAWPDALTEREREIIRLVEQGLSNKDIAHRLSISDSTVRHHMTNIFDKVGVSNRQKLLIHAHHFRSTPV